MNSNAAARAKAASNRQAAAAAAIDAIENKYKNNSAALEKQYENAQKANGEGAGINLAKIREAQNALYKKYKEERSTAYMHLRSAFGGHERTMT